MSALVHFQGFINATQATTLVPGTIYVSGQRRQSIVMPKPDYQVKLEALRAASDRITFEWICRYCEHAVAAGKPKCGNCGARRR